MIKNSFFNRNNVEFDKLSFIQAILKSSFKSKKPDYNYSNTNNNSNGKNNNKLSHLYVLEQQTNKQNILKDEEYYKILIDENEKLDMHERHLKSI